MADYSAEVAAALEAIRDAGTTATLRRVVPGAYDPVADSETGASVVTQVVPVVVLPLFRRPELRDEYMVTNSGIVSDHRKILMPARKSDGSNLSFEPRVADVLVFGTLGSPNTDWWKVDSVATLEPDGSPIVFTVLVTRGVGSLYDPGFNS